MEIIHLLSEDNRVELKQYIAEHFPGGTAVTLGKFDGIHAGHRKLIQNVVDYCENHNQNHPKDQACGSVLVAFGKATYEVVSGQVKPVLSEPDEKEALIRETGIDLFVDYPFTKELMNTDADTFLDSILKELLDCKYVTAGTDFTFGKNRRGNAEYLKYYGDHHGFQVSIEEKMQSDGNDISSTCIMETVKEGKMKLAKELLEKPYYIHGEVVHGNHMGTSMGFATANIIPLDDKLLPPNGVYVSCVVLDEAPKRIYPAITNIGFKPTVTNGKQKTVETNLLYFDGNLYGKKMWVFLIDFRRGERKFCTMQDLIEQVLADCDDARRYHSSHRITLDT